MAHAYTPGLRVVESATIRKERILPIAGKVTVDAGDRVRAEDVVARAELPGPVSSVNVVNQLGVAASDIRQYMQKTEGEAVGREEVIAETRPWIKWLRTVARSPADGTVESVSEITGQVLVRHPPRPVDVRAYIDGRIVEVRRNEGVVVETQGALVQGIFGVGGEVAGELVVACGGPDDALAPAGVTEDLAGKIVVAGELVSSDTYARAAEVGVAALIAGGVNDGDLRALLGYDIGVAITGEEPIRPIVIVTEGFGPIAMAQATFDLLRRHAGGRAAANGATQIRAGVLRPEIVIPGGDEKPAAGAAESGVAGLMEGTPVRIIREPGFGRIGSVKRLIAGTEAVESGAKVRVLEVAFPDGETTVVPRANVEAIERR